MKKESGITLISLVITIVILIILAGVGINLAIGNNGIFNKAKYSKEIYMNEQETEKKEINELSIEIEDEVESGIISFKEVKNYKMLYDGSAKTQEEREATSITNGWVDVTANCTSQYGSGSEKVTKKENAINLESNNNGSIPVIAINKNIGDLDFYKVYIKCTGSCNTNDYTGYSVSLCYLSMDPNKNTFSIYGNNDNRIDINNYGVFYSGTSYENKILSTYKPGNKNVYLLVYMSTYSSKLTSYSYSADMQSCWVVNQDNYTKLANYAGIEGTYTQVNDILNKECIQKICNSKEATEYMIKQCTGDFMCELLSNDEMISFLTPEVKNSIKENENWSKFIEIYGKKDLF